MIFRCVTVSLGICLLLAVVCSDLMADEKSHHKAAVQLVDLAFNYEAYHNNAMRYALLGIKDRYERNPKTQPYSDVLINAIMEVMEKYVSDPEAIARVKSISADLYAQEFTEREIHELFDFYRTRVGKKAVRKLPLIMQKQWEKESQIPLPEKYKQMIVEKTKSLQQQGMLPKDLFR